MKLLIVLLSCISLVLSCQNKKPVEVKKPKKPSWVLNPPKDSAIFLYGVGEGNSRKSAITVALGDLASKISVTVNAEFSSSLKVNKREIEIIKTDNQRVVNSKAATIKITQYEVTKVFSPLPTSVFVLVKVSRSKLINNYQHLLQYQIAGFNNKKANLNTNSKFARYKFLKQERAKLPEFINNRIILTTLDQNFNMKPYLNYEHTVNQELDKLTQAFKYQVIATDELSQQFVNSLNTKLAKQGLLADGPSKFKIKINATKTIGKYQGFIIQNFLLNLLLYENNNAVNSKQIAIKHVGTEQNKSVPSKVITKFVNQVQSVIDW